MVFGKSAVRDRRIGINDAENFFADSERDGQDGADALNRHRASGKARVVLRVRSQDGFALPDDFFDNAAADAYLADSPSRSRRRRRDLQIFPFPRIIIRQRLKGLLQDEEGEEFKSHPGRGATRDAHLAIKASSRLFLLGSARHEVGAVRAPRWIPRAGVVR